MDKRAKRIWVTWEDHRRSRELSAEFDAEYLPIIVNKSRAVRYPILVVLTFFRILRERPGTVFCQNPSIVLATLLVILKPLFRFKLIVDRHSNFKFESYSSSNPKWRLFHFLSRLTVNRSDITIVTNDHLKTVCAEMGGNPVVLEDKLPTIKRSGVRPPFMVSGAEVIHVMVVTAFGDDEPIPEIIEAGLTLKHKCVFYLTGNFRKKIGVKEEAELKGSNIVLTGFISEDEYCALLHSCDLALVLTKKEFILNCGAYEAFSASKPMVLSHTKTLTEYFRKGAVFVNINSGSIVQGIELAIENRDELVADLEAYKPELDRNWNSRVEAVQSKIDSLAY